MDDKEIGHISVYARRADPETSHEAAEALNDDQERLQRSVAAVVALLHDSALPISDFQILDLWPKYWDQTFSESLPRKARHWARQAGLVKHDGFGTHQNRRVRTWSIGRDEKFLTVPDICECCGQLIKRKGKD